MQARAVPGRFSIWLVIEDSEAVTREQMEHYRDALLIAWDSLRGEGDPPVTRSGVAFTSKLRALLPAD